MDASCADASPELSDGLTIDRAGLGRKKKTVMIIDDSADIRMIINETLNLYGFATVAAADGATGVKLAAEHRPDLIICDINMPAMDGFQTLQAMRAQELTSTIPFVFLSGTTDRVNIRKGMELGADDYVTKPFSPKEQIGRASCRERV